MSDHFKPCFLYIPIRYFSLLLFHDKIGIQIIELIKVADCALVHIGLQYNVYGVINAAFQFCHRRPGITMSFPALMQPAAVHSPWICTLVVVQSVMIAPANPHSSLAAFVQVS